MARTIQSLRRTIIPQTQSLIQFNQIQHQTQNPISRNSQFLSPQTRKSSTSSNTVVVSEMRKTAINNNLLRHLRNEIQFEVQDNPPQEPAVELNEFKVVDRPGEQWVSLEKRFEEREEIKVEITMFDGSIPVLKEGEKPGQPGEEVQMHVTMIVTLSKEEIGQALEFICSAWPDTLEIKKLYVRERAKMPKNQRYTGPLFGELDDELQDSLYNFLEERGVDDKFCTSLHKYIEYKDKTEYIHWLRSIKSALEQ